MATIFSRIISGEIPSYKIFDDEYTYAFLDVNPMTLGHTLIVPKVEVDYFVDVPEPYYTAVFQVAKKIAPFIQKATGCKRISTMIAGFEVHHFHYHLIPTDSLSDMLNAQSHGVTSEDLKNVQTRILQAMVSKQEK